MIPYESKVRNMGLFGHAPLSDPLAAFHRVRRIRYKRDDKDYWQTPQETLERGAGDCEDLAVLFVWLCGNMDGLELVVGTKNRRWHVWAETYAFCYDPTVKRPLRLTDRKYRISYVGHYTFTGGPNGLHTRIRRPHTASKFALRPAHRRHRRGDGRVQLQA